MVAHADAQRTARPGFVFSGTNPFRQEDSELSLCNFGFYSSMIRPGVQAKIGKSARLAFCFFPCYNGGRNFRFAICAAEFAQIDSQNEQIQAADFGV